LAENFARPRLSENITDNFFRQVSAKFYEMKQNKHILALQVYEVIRETGAGEGIRTLDPDLGNVGLYRLASYPL
jgi:hypothetical protein